RSHPPIRGRAPPFPRNPSGAARFRSKISRQNPGRAIASREAPGRFPTEPSQDKRLGKPSRRGRAGVKILSTDPLNGETSLENLSDSITPESQFFVRSHFARPDLARGKHTLQITGAVERSLTLSIEDLEAMDTRILPVTVECAGNGRAGRRPVPAGVVSARGAGATAAHVGDDSPMRMYMFEHADAETTTPVRTIRVRSLILSPSDGEGLRKGRVAVREKPWSGDAEVVSFHVEVDGLSRQASVSP